MLATLLLLLMMFYYIRRGFSFFLLLPRSAVLDSLETELSITEQYPIRTRQDISRRGQQNKNNLPLQIKLKIQLRNESYFYQQALDEDRWVQQSKCCDKNDKSDDNSTKVNNDNSSQKYRQYCLALELLQMLEDHAVCNRSTIVTSIQN